MSKIIRASLATVVALVGLQAATLDAPLLDAVQQGDAAKVRSLLKRGANPNAANSEGNTLTALMLAAREGRAPLVRLLLEAGAKVNATAAVPVGASGVNEGITALMEAASSGDAATVEALLNRRADPNAKAVYRITDATGGSRASGTLPVIMNAANFDVLRRLADHGANLHAKGENGQTVLMYAAAHLDGAAVRYLLAKGLDPRERDSHGLTALDLAVRAKKTENAEILGEKVGKTPR